VQDCHLPAILPSSRNDRSCSGWFLPRLASNSAESYDPQDHSSLILSLGSFFETYSVKVSCQERKKKVTIFSGHAGSFL
jgi:hypothetical protein